MTTRRSKPRAKKALEIRALSDIELARFLRQLGANYKDKRTGNPLLAMALKKLADRLDKENPEIQRDKAETQISLSFDDLSHLDLHATKDFVDDLSKTKKDLIELAAARFSIPRGKLLRMKSEDVREAVKAALQHENSLKIIGQEAERNGAFRRS